MKKCYVKILWMILSGILWIPSGQADAQIRHTQVLEVVAGNDDAEECVPGGSGTVGSMDLTSSDLEITTDGSKRQMVGIRFTNVFIPQGAVIERAYVQFATKGDKAPVSGSVYITAENTDDALMFSSTAFHISSRTQVQDSVHWAGSTSSSWGTSGGGMAGPDQRTPDIGQVIQPIINRAVAGTALIFPS